MRCCATKVKRAARRKVRPNRRRGVLLLVCDQQSARRVVSPEGFLSVCAVLGARERGLSAPSYLSPDNFLSARCVSTGGASAPGKTMQWRSHEQEAQADPVSLRRHHPTAVARGIRGEVPRLRSPDAEEVSLDTNVGVAARQAQSSDAVAIPQATCRSPSTSL